MADRKCFVITGFGKKLDFPTGRTLDLDGTYVGLGDEAKAKAWLERMGELQASDWMRGSTKRQVAALHVMLGTGA